MASESSSKGTDWLRDFLAGWALFLVAVPVSLGIAQAFGVSPYAGLIAGVIGGVVVGMISGSQTSISGPSAGLTAIILTEIASLQSFNTFLFALLLAGIIQIAFGLLRVGELSAFLPSSVVKGLVAAVGVILILKQIPHLLGHDTDPIGEMSFWQPDRQTTFSEFWRISGDIHFGAAAIGIISLIILGVLDQIKDPRARLVPGPLVVILFGSFLAVWLRRYDVGWSVEAWHFFRVPTEEIRDGGLGYFTFPSLEQWRNPNLYFAALLIAIVASLETLLNLNAVDQLDPERRHSPTNRELVAQGVGNTLSGMLGGLPITSRVVHSSVNINSGGRTKRAAVIHGFLFLICTFLLPAYLNYIPLSCIAAILFWTGAKMASPALFKSMWAEGRYQFIPFMLTMVAIIFTEKLIGAVIGLVVGVVFILNSNLRRPLRRIVEKHIGGELIRIELGNQVSFLNRGMLEQTLRETKPGSHLLLDASHTDYIDPDILSLIRDYKERTAVKHGVEVSLRGFKNKYSLEDETRFVDYSTRDLQKDMKPQEVLQILQDGNRRFQEGQPLFRDYATQLQTAAQGQFPFAVVLSCIDSRAPVETILDLGLGDIFSVRIAGNVVGPKVLGSLEYSCGVAGSKLIVVLGHTKCGAVTASVKFAVSGVQAETATGCSHLSAIVDRISLSIDLEKCKSIDSLPDNEQSRIIEQVTRNNVLHSIRQIVEESSTIRKLVEQEKIGLIGAIYNVASGQVEFLTDDAIGLGKQRVEGGMAIDASTIA
jgi:carbonic anhydrase